MPLASLLWSCLPSEETGELVSRDCITFTGRFFEAGSILNRNASVSIVNVSSALQCGEG